jgi:hypothetical protein
MGEIIKESAIVFIIGTILLTTGCVSNSAISSPQTTTEIAYNQSTVDVTTEYPPDPSHWIEIDPIGNFQTQYKQGLNRISFNVSGTTNLPINSLLFIFLIKNDINPEKDESALLWRDVVPVGNNGDNANTFFYTVNVTSDHIQPGSYRVTVRRQNVSNSTDFTILGKDPLPGIWIRIDPVSKHHRGDFFNITGTTNLPAGSNIAIRTEPENLFPCPLWAKEKPSNFSGTICGNDCDIMGFNKKIRVDSGAGGNNSWIISIDTTDWCVWYQYRIVASKDTWDNVSSNNEELRFYSE